MDTVKRQLRRQQRESLKIEADAIIDVLPPTQNRSAKVAQEKGSSTWVAALPIDQLGFCLSKAQFWDAVSMRYGWQLRLVPQKCRCGKDFEINHVLTCKVEGFHTIRHNQLRDTTADLLREFCNDVSVEPRLQPLTGEYFPPSTNTEDDARLDIRAKEFWDNRQQDAFFDLRVFYPFAPSYCESTLAANYRRHEQQKRREYGLRVREVDRGYFTPLVFTTGGGMAPEATVFFKQ